MIDKKQSVDEICSKYLASQRYLTDLQKELIEAEYLLKEFKVKYLKTLLNL